MKRVLVICKKTGQSGAFERQAKRYTEQNRLAIKWMFADPHDYGYILASQKVDIVLLSPEIILHEEAIKADLTGRKIEYVQVEPMDYGLRRIENIIPFLKLLLVI